MTAVTVAAALQAVISEAELNLRAPADQDLRGRDLGSFGGREMSYASDADVLFVYDPLPGVPMRRPRPGQRTR